MEKENEDLVADRVSPLIPMSGCGGNYRLNFRSSALQTREEESRVNRENELDLARDRIRDLERDVKESEKRYEEQVC